MRLARHFLQNFPLGDQAISRVGTHLGRVTGGAFGDEFYASFFLEASFLALTPR